MPQDVYRPNEYWEQLLANRFDLREVGYPELSLAYNECMYDAMADTVARGLRTLGISRAWLHGATVLDVGVGVGFWIEFWRAQGATRLTGIDLTQVSIERMSARYPELRFEQRDIAEPLEAAQEGRYDVISVMSVLNHIPIQARWEDALRNLARMLRPGGLLLVMDPIVRHTAWAQRADATANGRARTVAEHEAIVRPFGVRLGQVMPTFTIIANPVDTRTRAEFVVLSRWWGVLARIARHERAMRLFRAPVYLVDRLLGRLGYMPTSKVLFFRKDA